MIVINSYDTETTNPSGERNNLRFLRNMLDYVFTSHSLQQPGIANSTIPGTPQDFFIRTYFHLSQIHAHICVPHLEEEKYQHQISL